MCGLAGKGGFREERLRLGGMLIGLSMPLSWTESR